MTANPARGSKVGAQTGPCWLRDTGRAMSEESTTHDLVELVRGVSSYFSWEEALKAVGLEE
jgi:hypothetical protein